MPYAAGEAGANGAIVVRGIAVKAFLVGTAALVVAIGLILTLVELFGEQFQTSMWVSAVLGCYGIGSTVSGYLFIQSERYRAALLELAETHAKLADAHGRLAKDATHDAMTGMLKRAPFIATLADFAERRMQGSLMIVDADRFRSINDTYGHAEGDAALLVIAGLIRQSIRPGDIAGRLDGAEFGVYLPGCGHAESFAVGERIRAAVNSFPFQPAGRGRAVLTVSVGVETMSSEWPPQAAIRIADRRLEDAKIRGRNRVVTATAA